MGHPFIGSRPPAILSSLRPDRPLVQEMPVEVMGAWPGADEGLRPAAGTMFPFRTPKPSHACGSVEVRKECPVLDRS